MSIEQSGRPTWASINLDHLRFNTKQLMGKLSDHQKIMAIVKSDAYGHGGLLVARTLENLGIKRFGVATFEEGLELREKGIRSEIYILDGLMGPIEQYQSQRLYPVIACLEQLNEMTSYLSDDNRPMKLALKFDTGMGRLGFAPSQVDEVMKIVRGSACLDVNLVVTHLACADEENHPLTQRQKTLFTKLDAILKERGLIAETSLANSAALIDQIDKEHTWCRPGISLYGCYPNERQQKVIELKPVMNLKSKIVSLKELSQGSVVGYGASFETKRSSKIAVVPIGYADGYPRLASNRGHVLIKGTRAPIVGRVSMNLITVDVTDVSDVAYGDEVTLIGQDGDYSITAEKVAEWAETISYEIPQRIS